MIDQLLGIALAGWSSIPADVTGSAWLQGIGRTKDERVLVIAEGLLMYLPELEVKGLLDRLVTSSPNIGDSNSSGVVSKLLLVRRQLDQPFGIPTYFHRLPKVEQNGRFFGCDACLGDFRKGKGDNPLCEGKVECSIYSARPV